MSSTNELSRDEQETLYEEYLEDQRNGLRLEGADALKAEILRQLSELERRAWTTEIRQGIRTAIVVVESAKN
jgi:hypothetical protein